MRWFVVVLLFSFLTPHQPLFAQSKKDKSKKNWEKKAKRRLPPLFESVTVGQRVREDAFRSPRSTTVLNKKRLQEKRPRSVPEALMEESGVFVQKTNHGGGAPIIRGTVGPQVLILVDGVRLNNSTYRAGPNQYLNLIDPNYLKRLEVLRGPGSIAYGSYAFGGVISATTPGTLMTGSSTFRYGGSLLGRYGSADNELTAHASFGGSVSNFGFAGSVSYGYFGDLLGGGTLGTPDLAKDGKYSAQQTNFGEIMIRGQSGRQAFTGYQHFFADGKVRVRIKRDWNLQLAYQRAQHIGAGRAEQFPGRGRVRIYDNIRDLVYLRTDGHLRSIRTKMSFILSYHRQDENREQQTYDLSTFDLTRQDLNHDQAHTIGFSWKGQTRATSWLRLSYGIDFYGDVIESDAQTRRTGEVYSPATANFPEGSNYMTVGAYIMARFRLYQWARKSGLYLHIGERLNGFFASTPARDVLEAVSFQQVGHAPYASFQALVSPYLNVSLSYAEGFRAPNLQETASLGDQGNFFEVANPNLLPEISRTLELSVRARLPSRFQVWAAAYVSFWNNLIKRVASEYKGQREINGKQVRTPVNTDNARVFGVEAGGRWRIWRGLTLAGNITWTLGEEILPEPTNVEDSTPPLSRIPPLFGKLSLAYRFGRRGFLEIFVLGALNQSDISDRDKSDVRIPEGGTPRWWTLNIRGGANITRFAKVVFMVENLLDVQYKYHGSGVLGPGLSARLSLELTL